MFWYLISSVVMAVAGITVYIYYYQKGQFDDLEDVKFQIFRDDEKNP